MTNRRPEPHHQDPVVRHPHRLCRPDRRAIHSTLGSELPVSLNKEGYTFKGWSKDSFTGAVNVTAATKIDESMTIYAVFERKTPVVQKVESIKIEDLSSESKVINKKFNLFANILPENTDNKTLEWSASDPERYERRRHRT